MKSVNNPGADECILGGMLFFSKVYATLPWIIAVEISLPRTDPLPDSFKIFRRSV